MTKSLSLVVTRQYAAKARQVPRPTLQAEVDLSLDTCLPSRTCRASLANPGCRLLEDPDRCQRYHS
jgi:hypothetical protein